MAYEYVDNDVVARAQSGDVGSVEECCRVCHPIVLWVSRVYHSRAGEASRMLDREDLAGYANVALIKAIRDFRPEFGAKFTTYATQKIRSEVADAIRSKGIFPRREAAKGREQFSLNERDEFNSLPATRTPRPQDRAESVEIVERLLDAVRPDFRETARLWAMEGLNIPETGRAQGITASAVSSRLSQAIKSMREEAARLGLAMGPVWGVDNPRKVVRRPPSEKKGGRPRRPVVSDRGEWFESAGHASVHHGLTPKCVQKSMSGGWRAAGRRWSFADAKEVA